MSCSCNTGSLKRRFKSCTICSTKAACGRAKTNRYLGPFPASGKMTRFSARNFGSRATLNSSSSIPRATGRPPFRATKMSLRGSSLVATRAPNKFAGIPRPRPLTHGTAQAIVSPKTFSLPKTGSSRAGKVAGNFTGSSQIGRCHSIFSKPARSSLSSHAKFLVQSRRTHRCRSER